MMLWLVAATAWGVQVEVCVNYDVDFADSDVSGATEDIFHDNGLKKARGILIEAASSTATYQQYAETASGEDAGCATFNPSGSTYDVRVKSHVAATSAHHVYARHGSTIGMGSLFVQEAVSDWTPVGGTYSVTLPIEPHWQALAVAGRALLRNTAGRSALDIDVYFANPSTGLWNPPTGCPTSASCVDGTDVWLTNADADLKFKTAYYVGWVMLHDMGYDRSSFDKTADDSHCHVSDRSLTLGNLEHTTTGFAEGFAFWYASTVFNNSGEDNCSFVFWEDANWDQLEVCHEDAIPARHGVLGGQPVPGGRWRGLRRRIVTGRQRFGLPVCATDRGPVPGGELDQLGPRLAGSRADGLAVTDTSGRSAPPGPPGRRPAGTARSPPAPAASARRCRWPPHAGTAGG